MFSLQKRKNVSVPSLSQYDMTFPFTDLNVEEQRIKTCNFECALFCRDIYTQSCAYMDELLNAFIMLETSRHLPLKHLFFVDCLSFGGIASMLALSSRFGKVLGIEVSEETRQAALACVSQLRRHFPENCAVCDINFKEGSFSDYIPMDVDVIFLDSSIFTDHCGILDETVIVRSLLDLSGRLIKPVTLVIVTIFMSLEQSQLRLLGYSHLTCKYQRHKKHARDYNFWILQASK